MFDRVAGITMSMVTPNLVDDQCLVLSGDGNCSPVDPGLGLEDSKHLRRWQIGSWCSGLRHVIIRIVGVVLII